MQLAYNILITKQMIKLSECSADKIFYKGTIIIIKDCEFTPSGIFDKMYCMVSEGGSTFGMLDLCRSVGSINMDYLDSNVHGHHGVNKFAIFEWVKNYCKDYFMEEYAIELIDKLYDIVYVSHLSEYFKQTDRDLFLED